MASMPPITRWDSEAQFFDRVAEQQARQTQPIDPLALQRYSSRFLRRRFREEFRLRVAQDLRDKHVLDVGCGDGNNSVLLAKLGAHVTGIDISPKSIALAEKRAAISGVSDAVRFLCSPLETAEIQPHSFDLIWGDSILHHLIDNLEEVFSRLTFWAKPGALIVLSEPVNFNNALRRFRLALPVKTDATPDERPLEPAELAIVRRFLPGMRIRFFSLFGRLNRFLLVRFNYERSPAVRRAAVSMLAVIDFALLSLPVIRNLGGYAVIYGRTPMNCSSRAPDGNLLGDAQHK